MFPAKLLKLIVDNAEDLRSVQKLHPVLRLHQHIGSLFGFIEFCSTHNLLYKIGAWPVYGDMENLEHNHPIPEHREVNEDDEDDYCPCPECSGDDYYYDTCNRCVQEDGGQPIEGYTWRGIEEIVSTPYDTGYTVTTCSTNHMSCPGNEDATTENETVWYQWADKHAIERNSIYTQWRQHKDTLSWNLNPSMDAPLYLLRNNSPNRAELYDISQTFYNKHSLETNGKTSEYLLSPEGREEFMFAALRSLVSTVVADIGHTAAVADAGYTCYQCRSVRSVRNNGGYFGIPDQLPGTIMCAGCVRKKLHFCSRNTNHYTVCGSFWMHRPPMDRSSMEPPRRNTLEYFNHGGPMCNTCATQTENEPGAFCRYCLMYCTLNSFVRPPDISITDSAYQTMCNVCLGGIYLNCSQCGAWARRTDSSERMERCSRCIGNSVVHNYSFKPEPLFLPEYKKGNLYMGMELETCFHVRAREWVQLHGADYFPTDLFYIKSDSSLDNGVEFVTHPFTPEWGMDNFPIHIFDDLVAQRIMLPHHQSSGQHIHVSKEAFSTAHLWKFCMVHWKYKAVIELIGGRTYHFDSGTGLDTTNWNTGRPPAPDALTKAAKQLANKGRNAARGVALNFQNPNTIELRYPTGTAVGTEILKNIEWTRCIYEFSKMLSVEDMREKTLADAGYLLGYILENKQRWPNLSAWVEQKIPTPKTRKMKEKH